MKDYIELNKYSTISDRQIKVVEETVDTYIDYIYDGLSKIEDLTKENLYDNIKKLSITHQLWNLLCKVVRLS